jgi:predicted DNA-binding WGR domain protein
MGLTNNDERTTMMGTMKWCLLKESDGARGAAGKRKVYEVTVDGDTVYCSWGMAEKASRQSSVTRCWSHQSAVWAAREKVSQKLAKGYEIAYQV